MAPGAGSVHCRKGASRNANWFTVYKMKNILVLGGDADGNLGDAAILAAICQRFLAINPNVAITIVSRRHRPGELPGVVRSIVPGPGGFGALLAAAPKQHLIVS
jgi:hypothetical protein